MPTDPHSQDFIDLEIRIFPLGDAGYPVEITLGGQQEFPRGHLPPDITPWVSSGDWAADGRRLFEALLSDPVLRSAWAEARGRAARRRIRLRIDPAAAELHSLPWELLQEETAGMLTAQADTPFSRYMPIALPWSGPVEERPIRILVVISNPNDLAGHGLAAVDVAAERAGLEAAFAAAGANQVQAIFLDPPVTPERIEAALREGCHVLHYLGHGAFNARRGQASLYLQDERGDAQLVADDLLAALMARQGVRPRLVVLIACQSAARATSDAFLGLGPKLVSAGVPAVVAMQDVVTIESGRKFSAALYGRLLEHGCIDRAVNEARSTLLTAGRPDAAVPVLLMRLKSGQLWSGESDARGEVLGAPNPRIFWSGLIRMIQQGKCTPIIGHRVHGTWLPAGDDIARAWACQHGYPFRDKENLPRVAQYLASNQGADFPRYDLLDFLMRDFKERLPEGLRPRSAPKTLSALVRTAEWRAVAAGDPNEVHRVLASLNLPLYLTTNYDNFMTEALVAVGKQPTREICRWKDSLDSFPSCFEDHPDYEPSADQPLVYHLFGSDEEPDSLVLTEDEHLDFLVRVSAEMERIPAYLWAALANSSLMFLGYSVHDWQFRVIMRGLVATREQRRKFKHVAVQLELGDRDEEETQSVRAFLQQYFQDAEVNVYWGSVQQFVAELREEWEKTRP